MEVEDPLDNGVEAFSNNISMNDPWSPFVWRFISTSSMGSSKG
jgi:hypothetical protein